MRRRSSASRTVDPRRDCLLGDTQDDEEEEEELGIVLSEFFTRKGDFNTFFELWKNSIIPSRPPWATIRPLVIPE